MKFYISARVKDIDKVKELHKTLEKEGHECIFDWTELGNLKPYDKDEKISEEHALNFEKSIKDSDIFILITDQEGTGMYTELGIAISEKSENEKPDIYVIGDHTSRSLFYFHPLVNRKKTIDELLDDLRE